jgi:DNA modification methylase
MLMKTKNNLLNFNFNQDSPVFSLPQRQHPILRLNAICPYYTMFPLSFPFNKLISANSGDWVLDPFCGRGTTNFAARLKGLSSVGLDANPVAVAIAQAKFIKTTPRKIVEVCQDILKTAKNIASIPEGLFWDLCYHPDTLYQISQIRESLIDNCETPERVILRALMLGILHGPRMKGKPSYLSNQMPRSYATKPASAIKYWDNRGDRPIYVDVCELVKRRSTFILTLLPPLVKGNAYLHDSRQKFCQSLNKKFKWVITSPPYYGMRSYIPDQWLRYWFVGGPPTVVYGKESLIQHKSVDIFINDLSVVWRNVAMICENDANLVIRFGSLPSNEKDSANILIESLNKAECGWEISSIVSAGNAGKGRRQSNQFLQETSTPCEEIDLCAKLKR